MRLERNALVFCLLACPAAALSPLSPDAILDASNEHAAPSHEIFSRERLRLEHVRRLVANTALETAPQPCPSNCSYPHGGFCDVGSGVCFCNRGWQGSSCSEEWPCAVMNCSGHGTCVKGVCQCDLGSKGEACETDTCPHHCHASAGRGHCVLGTCACGHGWSGASCSTRPIRDCPVDAAGLVCSGHGACDVEGKCTCFHTGYAGADCSVYSPPAASSEGECAKDGGGLVCGGPGRGVCDVAAGACECLPGYSGDACGGDDCFVHALDAEGVEQGVACSGHGNCTRTLGAARSHCACEIGYDGADCGAESSCPSACSGRGYCVLQPDLRSHAVVSLSQQIALSLVAQDSTTNPTPTPAPTPAATPPAADAPMRAVCVCNRGWEGADCAEASPCPAVATVAEYNATHGDPATCVPGQPCCGHGACTLGDCKCNTGYHGTACARFTGILE